MRPGPENRAPYPQKPFLAVLVLYLLCFALRLWEYFVLRTDQGFAGEAIVHKLAGIIVLCIALRLFSLSFGEIGFAKAHAAKDLRNGLLFGLSVFAVAYGVEILLSVLQGGFRSLQFYVSAYALGGNTGYRTAPVFFLLCIAGNIVNVIMEEGMFRGLFQQVLQSRYSFLFSAIAASCLFGIWHIAAPLRNYFDGLSTMGGFIATAAMLLFTSGLVGFKFALLSKMTGSLYMAMGDHFVNNTIVNILHVVSSTGTDSLQFVRITIAQSLSFVLVLLFYLKKRKGRSAS